MDVKRKEYSIKSVSGLANIFVRCWYPENEVKAVFQVTHGMAEHGERYEDMAKYFCSQGFAFIVNDHIGHGKSAASDDDLGYFGEKDGWNVMVEDERAVTELVKKEFPGVPVIYYGHSMGSFIGREYIRRYGNDEAIKGAVICGTAGKNPAAGIAIILASAVIKMKGSKYRSNFINNLAFGAYNKKISSPATEFDWLTTDGEIVRKYIDDKYCGFLFTAAGFRDLFTLLNTISGKNRFNGLNRNLPVLLVAGEEDPVGSYGKGVKEVYNDMKNYGLKDITLKLYPGMRHEIHNEKDRAKVYEELCTWAKIKANI